ncbi:MAG: hypothetical protein B6D77_01745 [gamma proteobacterium symbiont of Ctena orbiculata]|nr:MAG: hypothetical protein B6D77_01745 [gamma proteobacterium symbiont of Ctena orbiculata]
MSQRVFISFKAEDRKKIDGLRLLAKNPDYELDFYDESVRSPINSTNAPYIKTKLKEKINRSGVVLCVVNTDTHTSEWVSWELEKAIELKKPIVAMAVKGINRATLPSPIRNKVKFYPWNPSSLNSYLNGAKNVK